MSNIEQAQNTLDQIVATFKNPEKLESTVKLAYIDDSNTRKPSSAWSFRNKFIQFMNNTRDGRSYEQWGLVKRYVKKGSKAFYILRPTFKNYCPVCSQKSDGTKTDTKFSSAWYDFIGYSMVRIFSHQKDGVKIFSCGKCQNDFTEKEVITQISNFTGIPKFRMEDTYGCGIPEYKPKKLPQLLDVAKAWDIKVEYAGSDHGEYGFYSPKQNLISLASEDPSVFFHELAHVADSRVQKGLKNGQDPIQEAVAELVAGVLCKMYGVDRTKVVHDYIEHYCTEKGKNKVEKMCLKILSRTQKVLAEIFEQKELCETPIEVKN